MREFSRYAAIPVLAAAGLLAGCSAPARPVGRPPTPVRSQVAEMLSSSGAARYTASIAPHLQIDLAFKVGGYVESIHQVRGVDGSMRDVQEGDPITRGTVLAQLRPKDYDVKVNQASGQLEEARSSLATGRNQLAEAEVGLSKARIDFERARTLFASDSITKPDYDSAKSQLDLAQARTETAKSQVVLVEARIRTAESVVAEAGIARADTALAAPISGILLQRSAEVGTLVAAGRPAFVLADTSTVKAVFGVPDLEVQALKPGRALVVTVQALPGADFPGRITAIAPSADARTRLFEVEVTISNRKGLLKAGMIASISLASQSTRQITVVPLSAITRARDRTDRYGLFVVEEQNGVQMARQRDVTLGDVYGNRVEVTAGVKAGERVITTGTARLVDGEQIQILP